MKKNGFTLIELISVIVILSIIIMLIIPTIINNISDKKEEAYQKNIDIILSAARGYVIDYDIETPTSISLDELCGTYFECPIINPKDNEEIEGYVVVDEERNYYFINGLITLEVDLNGGSTSQEFDETYLPYTKIDLKDPIRDTYTFDKWIVVRGNSIIKDSNLTIGTEDTIIRASWLKKVGLEVDLNGGSTTQEFETIYEMGTNIVLNNPTKKGYTFTGWQKVSGDSILSGDNLTIGSVNTVIKATYSPITYTINYNVVNDSSGNSYPNKGTYDSILTIKNPIRTGYTFDGWMATNIDTTTAKYGTTTPNTIWNGITKVKDTYFINLRSSDGTVTMNANYTATSQTLTVNLNGGTTSQSFKGTYKTNEVITLTNPTRAGYTFTGWSVTSGNSILSGNKLTMGSQNTTITANWKASTTIPIFTYTGSYQIVDDNDNVISNPMTWTGNWKIRFLTSGTLTFTTLNGASNGIDAFLVGGGGSGAKTSSGAGGGGGGFTTTLKNIEINVNKQYEIIVGNSGEDTKAFAIISKAGYNGKGTSGGNGGSGGGATASIGGTDGEKGKSYSSASYSGGMGQGSTTREFGEASGKLYAGGGGGGPGGATSPAQGGSGGGGSGSSGIGSSGTPNTGGGGGGGKSGGGSGGSGIVIIRNSRNSVKSNNIPKFTYTGEYQIIYEDSVNWKIRFLTSGTLTFTTLNGASNGIDAFLVGGGGNGAQTSAGGGGGGGGFTITRKNIGVSTNTSYEIIIGNSEEDTKAFSTLAKAGYSAKSTSGGNGGSGGGATASYGGSDGVKGKSYTNGTYSGGIGQNTTTREFGDPDGDLYAGGGGGGPGGATSPAQGGSGGGGSGSAGYGGSGTPNTGGGGGGGMSSAGTGGSGIVIIRDSRNPIKNSNVPKFTYTGEYQIIYEDSVNWKIKFLTSGTLTFTTLNGASSGIDAFLVGGGGNGSRSSNGAGGGGGGYTTTKKNFGISINTQYQIVVGNAGQNTEAFAIVAKAGSNASGVSGGNGGSGGGAAVSIGGSDGGKGNSYGSYTGGTGQNTTTREFGDPDGDLYAGGGGGGPGGSTLPAQGGSGGGGSGSAGIGSSGMPNTGGGGGGGMSVAGSGGSGIVIIRNRR